MSILTAPQLHDVLTHVTTGENRARIEARESLRWMLAELDASRDALGERLGGTAGDRSEAVLKASARDVDKAFDRALRRLYHFLEACRHLDDTEQASAAVTAQEALFPTGLNVVNLKWRDAAARAPVFARRLEREDVVAGLDVAAGHVKHLRDKARDVVRHGESLSGIVAQIDAGAADQASLPGEVALFDVRREASRAWSVFAEVVEHALAGEDDARDRNHLLQRARAFAADARPEAPIDAPVVPSEGDGEPNEG